MSGTRLKMNPASLVLLTGGVVAVAIACSAAGSGPGGGSGANGNNGGAGTNGGGNGATFPGSGGDGFTPGGGGAAGGGAGGTESIDPKSVPSMIDDCTGQTDAATLAALRAGGAAGGMRFLYPYDGTVWPRGLLGPVLQWEGGGGDAVYLKIQSQEFLYEGCFGAANAPLRLPVPQRPWVGAGEWSKGAGDPATVTLSVRSGGQVQTITQTWNFALATIKGAIYYNTYASPSAGNNGAIMKILPGEAQPTPFVTEMGLPPLGPCVSCHSLSADGSTMTANRHLYPGNLTPAENYTSRSYDVGQNATLVRDRLPEAGFAGIYPDGSRLVTNGPPYNSANGLSFPNMAGNVASLVGPAESHVVDTNTGAILGAGPALHAQMPMFSPDGTKIVYNDHDNGAGHALWVADFNASNNTFSNKREIFRDAARFPGWPFFTPDGEAVIFVLGTRPDFVSQLPDPNILVPDATGRSHLRITYLNTAGQSTPLDAANGWRNGNFYPPAGAARDNDLEFFPTVSPVAAGGYYWVFYTSRRTYGNISAVGLEDPHSKKIWVAAVSIGGAQGADPSHPAFFLPGQEVETGNVRAFAALEPCKEDGSSCTSGTECCSGYCINGICGPPAMCSQIDDRCEVRDDCCDPYARCIGGYCADIPVQ